MDCSMSKKTKLEVIQKIEALMLGGGNYKNNRADMHSALSMLGRTPWVVFSAEELEFLCKKDSSCLFLTVLLDKMYRNQAVVSFFELEKSVFNIVSTAVNTALPGCRRKKIMGVLSEEVSWFLLPEDFLCSILTEVLIENKNPKVAINPFELCSGVEYDLFREKPKRAKKLFEIMCENILEKTKKGEYFFHALCLASDITHPLYTWNGGLYERLLKATQDNDPDGDLIAHHLCYAPPKASEGREELYREVISHLCKGQGSKVFLKHYMESYEGRKFLCDLPWVHSPILDHLAEIDTDKEQNINITAEIARLPGKSKERFLKKALKDEAPTGNDGYHALMKILCFRWGEEDPVRKTAEQVIFSNNRSQKSLLSYFGLCLKNKVFTEGDFFLETLVSLFSKAAPLQPGEPDWFNGLECLVDLLFLSLSEPGGQDSAKTLELHTKLIDGPLRFLFDNQSIISEESAECQTRWTEYLSKFGVMKQEYSNPGCHAPIGDMVF